MTAPTEQPKTLAALQAEAQKPRERNLPAIMPGFGSLESFELLHRQAKVLVSCDLVPTQYRSVIEKRNYKGEITSSIENPRALANCAVALNMATRMGADPFQVMLHLVVIDGRPTWSSQFILGAIETCGRYEEFRFDVQDLGKKKLTREYFVWENNDRKKCTETLEIDDKCCVAWALPRGVQLPHNVQTLEDAKAAKLPVIKGPEVSVGMAFLEGWYSKNGSKWRTMPELMLHYRAGAFFGRLYTPGLLMGLHTTEEVQDIQELKPQSDGSYAADLDSLRRGPSSEEPAAPIEPTSGESRPAAEATAAPADKPASGSDGSDMFPASDAGSKPGRKARAQINAE